MDSFAFALEIAAFLDKLLVLGVILAAGGLLAAHLPRMPQFRGRRIR